ncbi:MAG: PIG-L family deacetylase [Chloroflexi bacterium]|nr:PIG-L family deacetylase [Chloroflexota bacterium]
MADAEAAVEARRALVVMAHPDDIEFTCGGTVAQLSDEGWHVTFCLVTSGDKGTKDPKLGPADLGALREAEQEAASRELGIRRCIFLRVPDGHVEDGSEFRGQMVRVLRDVRPELLITWDGYRGFNHRDHRTVGIAALDAAFPLARNANSYAEQVATGIEPVRVNTVLLAGSNEPNFFVDVSEQQGRRIDALLRHASQVQAANRDEMVKRMQRRSEMAARAGRVPWAEGFRRLTFGEAQPPRRSEALRAEAKARESEQASDG